MNIEADDYSSDLSSSSNKIGESGHLNGWEVSTNNVKQPGAIELETSRNGPNSTRASLVNRELKYLKDQDSDSQGLSTHSKNRMNGDCDNGPCPKRLKTDNTSTNASTTRSVNVTGGICSSGLSASSDKYEQSNVINSAQKTLEDNQQETNWKDLETTDNTMTRIIQDSTQEVSEGDLSNLVRSEGNPKDADNVQKKLLEIAYGKHGGPDVRPPENHSSRNNRAAPYPAEPESKAEDDGDSGGEDDEHTVHSPAFILNRMGAKAHVDITAKEREPLFFTDVKELLAFSGVDLRHSPKPGGWWQLSRPDLVPQTVFVLIEGLALDDFVAHRDCFPNLDEIFPSKLEVITPAAYNGSFVEELVLVPMSRGKQKGLLRNYSCLEGALLRHNNLFGYVALRKDFWKHGSKEEQESQEQNYKCFLEVLKKRRYNTLEKERKLKLKHDGKKIPTLKEENLFLESEKLYLKKMSLSNLPKRDRFPRTKLILSRNQHISEGVPTPLTGCFADRYADYIPTKDLYAPATNNSPMFGLDCEMVMTTLGGSILELARISIVDEDMKCIYDELVKPDNRVTNYLTPYSGMTAALLANVTKRLGDVHREIRALLPMDAILVGHSISNDLHALRMVHPYLIDTSLIFNVNENFRCKSKLALLSQQLLGKTIQKGKGHCSTEDSEACLKLVQLKLSKDIAFGDTMLKHQKKILGSSLIKAMNKIEWERFPISSQRVGFTTRMERDHCQVVKAEKLSREIQKLDLRQPMRVDMKKDWMLDMVLADPLFGLLKFVGKSAALVGTSDVISRHNQYKPEVRKKLDHFVKVVTAKDTKDVFAQVTKNLCYQFVVGHAHFDAKVVEKAKTTEKKMIFSEIDKSCRKIWDGVAADGMCIIVFGGRARGTNGLCFVRLNNDVQEIIKHTPKLSQIPTPS